MMVVLTCLVVMNPPRAISLQRCLCVESPDQKKLLRITEHCQSCPVLNSIKILMPYIMIIKPLGQNICEGNYLTFL